MSVHTFARLQRWRALAALPGFPAHLRVVRSRLGRPDGREALVRAAVRATLERAEAETPFTSVALAHRVEYEEAVVARVLAP